MWHFQSQIGSKTLLTNDPFEGKAPSHQR